MTVLVNLVVAVGMLFVVPAGLRLIGGLDRSPARRLWPYLAPAGAGCLWLPRGPVALTLAASYAALTALLAAEAPRRLLRRRIADVRELAVLTALVSPAVAGIALVAERAGHQLFGFKLGILALTVAHFHFAGFAAALLAGLVAAAAPAGRLVDLAAGAVPVGTAGVFLGYFTSQFVELAGAVVLTAGMWAVGWLTWRQIRAPVADRLTRLLLGVCATVLAATMVLALSWALGEAVGTPHPSLAWMAATHGLANALGFGGCGVLAWRRLRPAPL